VIYQQLRGIEMVNYSNPRLEAVIDNWPIGAKRTTATFRIEAKKGKGERATRFTIDPKTGWPSATKVITFSKLARIVDGDDGRTYIARLTEYGFISVFRGDMQIEQESVWPKDERYAAIAALFSVS
jgi:hypothetical protein